jgi:predicted PurR-regulated permease PerM
VAEDLIPRVWARRLMTLGFVALVGLLLAKTFGVLAPFLLAWIAAYLASPLVDLLEKRFGASRERAVIIVMLVIAALFVVLVAITIPPLIEEATILTTSFPKYRTNLIIMVEEWKAAGRIPPEFEMMALTGLQRLQEAAPSLAPTIGGWLLSGLGSLLGFFEFLLDGLLFVFVFYYFLLDFHVISANLVRAVPSRWRGPMRNLLAEIDVNLRTVLRGQFLVAITMAGLYAIGLSIAGIPYAIVIGIISGLGNFLPYVGPLLGMIPAFLLMALHFGLPLSNLTTPAISILVVFGIVQFLESFILTPRLAGKSVGLGPVAVLFAVSVGGVLLGLVGVVAALPIAAILKVLLKRAWAAYQSSEFYDRDEAEA